LTPLPRFPILGLRSAFALAIFNCSGVGILSIINYISILLDIGGISCKTDYRLVEGCLS
jgi:hypothetical protein